MDDEFEPPFNPARLLPFTCELEPHDPNVERLPSKYIGSDQVTYAGDKLFYQE